MRSLANYVGFQLGWFACVGGAAHGAAWLGPAAAALLIAAHLASSPRRVREFRRLAAVGLFGLALESAAIAVGLYGYAGGGPVWWLAPAWIVALWVLIGATFESSLSWLSRRPWLAAAFGAVGSPLSFSAGMRMGAARFLIPTPIGLAALAALWAAALPLAFQISRIAGREA
jgi:hypothetical protein